MAQGRMTTSGLAEVVSPKSKDRCQRCGPKAAQTSKRGFLGHLAERDGEDLVVVFTRPEEVVGGRGGGDARGGEAYDG